MSMSRVTITIPPDVLEDADRRAQELDRSRSWVVVEALKAWLNHAPASAGIVREAPAAYAPGLGPTRRAQLEADLALGPEERVRLAEETARVPTLRGRTPLRDRVIVFDRHEDFLAWERREALDW